MILVENLYTEAKLKKLNKDALIQITTDNEIEATLEMTKDAIIALILAKACADLGAEEETPTADVPDDQGSDKEKETPIAKPETPGAPKFTVEQLLASSTYSHRRDVLRMLLDENTLYSHADIADILKEFYERKVN